MIVIIQNVDPDPLENCGPYSPVSGLKASNRPLVQTSPDNHDTISMVVVDDTGRVAAGSSTNGLRWKIAGSVLEQY